MRTFRIPQHWRVFVLDDSEDRQQWFRERIPTAKSAKTTVDAIALLSSEKFDLVFLDHDLSWLDAGFPDRQFGNGKEVARYLARTGFAGRVVIHSKSDEAETMHRILPAAIRERFGDFEITVERAAAAQ